MKKILLIALMSMALTSNAQNDTSKAKQDTLKEVQVIGVTNSKNLPISQTKFSCKEYDFLNQQNDPFFIVEHATPSVYAQSDNGQENGYSYMRMRGLDQTRINYNINGIPINEMEDQGLYFSNMPGFYNYLGSINVERGIGSSKYGNTSIAGSVDMETRDMSEKTFEISSLLKDSYNDQNSNFFYSSGIGKNDLAVQLGGSYIKNEGFKDHSGNQGGSGFYSIGMFKKHNIFKIYGFNGIAHNQLAFYGVPMSILDTAYKTNLNAVTDRDTFNQNMVALNWINYSSSKVRFNTTIYFDNVKGEYNTAGILFGVNSYQYGVMSNMVIESGNNTINIGINSNIYSRRHFGSDSSGYYGVYNNTYYTNTGHKEDVILYVKGENKSPLSTFYDIQVRSVWFNATQSKDYHWLFLNPKLGLRTPGERSHLYIDAGITEREPTRTDMIQNIVQSDKAYGGNTDNTVFLSPQYDTVKLHPELVYDVEIGNKYHSKHLDVDVNCYLMVIDHEFVATGVIDNYSGFMDKQAVNQTMRSGLEANIKSHFNNLMIFFNGNLQHSDYAITAYNYVNNIPFTPNFIGSLGASYKIKRYNIGIIEQCVSSMSMSITDNYTSSPYQITNVFGEVKISNMYLSLKVNNVFNNKYYIPAGVYGTPTFYVGQLANYSISLKCKI